MKNQIIFVSLLIAAILLTSCRFSRPDARGENPTNVPTTVSATTIPSSTAEPQIQASQFVSGRNDYVMDVDGTPREFIVYVPVGYDPNVPTPVVYMIHGSNMSGQKMYENTHWARKSDEETIIIVYPTSWKYPLIDENGLHEKWNTPGTATEVVLGTELKDDVKFMRTILDSLKATFNIDDKRIFASGFSNGGGFVLTRLIPQMNDVFAAYSTSGSGLLGDATSVELPIQTSGSLYSIIGTNDNKLGEGQSIPVPFPLNAEEITNHPNFGPMLEKTSSFLALDTSHTVESDSNFTRLIYNTSLTGADNEYIFLMLKGLFHVYPDGEDNRAGIDAANLFWDFFLKHPKP